MNLYLIRHGEVVKQYLHRYVGSTDVGLSRNGKKQLEKTRSFFEKRSIDVLYTSQRKRAIQTATAVFPKHTMTIDQRLAEIDLGSWEGKTSRQVKNMLPKNVDCEAVTSGGELYADFVKRVKDFLADIQKKHRGETIVIVTHKGVIRELYKQLLQNDELIVDQDYGCINHVIIGKNKVDVIMTNYLYV
jgi:broad specificity phosphatase PhoE